MKFIQAFEKTAEGLGAALGGAFARRKAGITAGGVTPPAPPPPPPSNTATQSGMFAGIRNAFGG